MNYTFSIPALVFPRDTPIGTVAYSAQQQATPSTGVYLNCSSGLWAYSVSGGTQVAADPSTYATNVPGIGMRFYRAQGVTGSRSYYGPTNTGTFAGNWAYNDAYFGVEIVVTGPVGSGTLDGALVGTFTQEAVTVVTTRIIGGASITSPTCSVLNSSIPVTLPTANTAKLSNLGATTGAQPFSINLSCTQGINVKVTLTDASNPSNRSTTLSLAQGSTAAGVGLQILTGSTPIAYGPDSSSAGNQNQWSAGSAAGGPMSIPLTVQYVRTAGVISPGAVRGLVTFTMSYQ